MKKLFVLIFYALMALTVSAQEYYVSTPGTLNTLVGDSADTLVHIRVTGNINAADISFIHSLAWPVAKAAPFELCREEEKDTLDTNLRYVDLEDATIEKDSLPAEAFYPCYLREIKLPKNLRVIGPKAMHMCLLLKEINIPQSVRVMGPQTLDYSMQLERVTLPDSLETIPAYAFSNCTNLRYVHYPAMLKTIGASAFGGCTRLADPMGNIPESVETLEDDAFCFNDSLTEVVIPAGIKKIGNSFFFSSPSLKKVTTYDCQDVIPNDAFFECPNIEQLTIGEGVTTFSTTAFRNKKALKRVDFPSTLSFINNFVFEGIGVDSLFIPDNVIALGAGAFQNLLSLKKVYSLSAIPAEVVDNPSTMPFNETSVEQAVLYVPVGATAAYRNSNVFKDFGTIVELGINEWPTSIKAASSGSNETTIRAMQGALLISGTGSSVSIYTMSGRQIWCGTIKGNAQIPLPRGFYIVVTDNTTRKIAL